MYGSVDCDYTFCDYQSVVVLVMTDSGNNHVRILCHFMMPLVSCAAVPFVDKSLVFTNHQQRPILLHHSLSTYKTTIFRREEVRLRDLKKESIDMYGTVDTHLRLNRIRNKL